MSETANSTVTIYSTERCPACSMTKKKFEAMNVPFVEVMADDQVRTGLREKGFSSMPVVQFQSEDVEMSWAGFNMNKIKEAASMVLGGANSLAWA